MLALKNLLNYRVPLFLNLILLIGVALLVVGNIYLRSPESKANPVLALRAPEEAPLTIVRKHNLKFTQPLLLTGSSRESTRLAPLKSTLTNLINQYQQQSMITAASVYFMDLNSYNWFSINPSERYTPGSLVKVPVIMTYLKKSEQVPGLLDQTIYFDPKLGGIPHQTYEVNPVKAGQSYPVRELLQRVASTSDNNSTALVNSNIDRNLFTHLFEDLDQVVPNLNDVSYQTNVSDYSKFFLVLFNGSYLNETNSEMALDWLSQSTFNEGLTKFLPPNITVARKFGEYGVQTEKQWHESGIVYYDNHPYLITIMTRGYDTEKLRLAISELSRNTFEFCKSPPVSGGI